MLTATEEPRVDLRLRPGSRTLGTSCHTGASHSSWSPAVAALLAIVTALRCVKNSRGECFAVTLARGEYDHVLDARSNLLPFAAHGDASRAGTHRLKGQSVLNGHSNTFRSKPAVDLRSIAGAAPGTYLWRPRTNETSTAECVQHIAQEPTPRDGARSPRPPL
jgi:hypothetical protein